MKIHLLLHVIAGEGEPRQKSALNTALKPGQKPKDGRDVNAIGSVPISEAEEEIVPMERANNLQQAPIISGYMLWSISSTFRPSMFLPSTKPTASHSVELPYLLRSLHMFNDWNDQYFVILLEFFFTYQTFVYRSRIFSFIMSFNFFKGCFKFSTSLLVINSPHWILFAKIVELSQCLFVLIAPSCGCFIQDSSTVA